MEFDPFAAALPIIIAAAVKSGLLLYILRHRLRTTYTVLFALVVAVITLQDVANIRHLYVLADGRIPTAAYTTFYALGIITLALVLHFTVTVSISNLHPRASRWIVSFGYGYAAALLVLLLFTDTLLHGLEPVGYTVTRIPGLAYPALEAYVFLFCLQLALLFGYGALHHDSSFHRARNALLLAGALPGLAVMIVLMTLLHFGVRWVNATAILPLTTMAFALVATYAIYRHRIIDPRAFLPWSAVHRQQVSFHDRVRCLIAEIADLPSANQILNRLAETLGCPVALVTPPKAICAGPQGEAMTHFPASELADIDETLVTREIADTDPVTYQRLRSRGVGAVVPFHPYSENASGWLLLGESLSDQIHSPLDFELVEKLFEKMSELFLDRFVTLRSQLRAARREAHSLELQKDSALKRLENLEKQYQALKSQRSGQQQDVLAAQLDIELRNVDRAMATPVLFIGRDKDRARYLADHFRSTRRVQSAGARTLQNASPPEVVVARLDRNDGRLVEYLSRLDHPFACVLYGAAVTEFAKEYTDLLDQGLVDVIPGVPTEQFLLKRVRSIAHLRRHTFWLAPELAPLIGSSQALKSLVRQLEICAGFDDPVLIAYDDPDLAAAAADYVHHCAGRRGALHRVVAPELVPGQAQDEAGRLALNLDTWNAADQELLARILQTRSAGDPRWLLGCAHDGLDRLRSDLRELTKTFTIQMPRLHERRDDIPLLVHFYTLLFNRSSGRFRNLTPAEVRSLKLHEPGWTLAGLRASVFKFLIDRRDSQGGDADSTFSGAELASQELSLDDLVGEFERRVIQQALDKAGGNQAETARLLGVRPNTLYYKLERYGLDRKSSARAKAQGTARTGKD